MKILIIQQKMIGDVLTSSILCEALKLRYASCEIHYLVNKNTIPVLEGNPYIDHYVIYTSQIAGNHKLRNRLRKQLKATSYDITIDVYSKIGSARMAYATRAKKIIGYKKWYTKRFYTHLFRYHYESKTNAGLAIENRMKLLQAIDTNFPMKLKPKIYLSAEENAFAKAQLQKHDITRTRPLYMISVLGSSDDKTYPLEDLAKVLDHLVAVTNCQLLFNYIPNQVAKVNQLLDLCTAQTRERICLDLYGKSLRSFIALTTQCDALIGNEGGAINMAKAVGIPTFAIFSPWIRKEAWALYENKQNHIVHLQNIQPELYERRSLKSIRKESNAYYAMIPPLYVTGELDTFLFANKRR